MAHLEEGMEAVVHTGFNLAAFCAILMCAHMHTNLKWFSRKGCISGVTQYPCSGLCRLDPQRKDPEKYLTQVSGTVVKLLTVPG